MSIKSSIISNRSDLGALLAKEHPGRYFANHPLASYTTSGTGGQADHLVIAANSADIWHSYHLALEADLPVTLIGGGSGVLVSDVGCPGLVIINRARGIWFDTTNNQVLLESGVLNRALVIGAYEREMGAVEWLLGVPGTIGGAVATQAGFDGQFLTPLIKEVTVAGRVESKISVIHLAADQLKLLPDLLAGAAVTDGSRPVILSVKLQLTRLPQLQIKARMDRIRNRVERWSRVSALIGYCWAPSRAVDERRLAKELRLANLRLLDSRLARVVGRGVNSRLLRNQVERWQDHLERQTGQALARRLEYLGYWPDDEQGIPTG
ncbi:MAG: FAD-binding protein [Patescibacteria group bacterium]